MKITILVENTEGIAGTKAEHGLSVYVETLRHKLLSDTGASDAMIHNADVLGVNLKQVDTLVLSHGHYDHCGGALSFAQRNPDAKIYLRKLADGSYYDDAGKYIGIDPKIMELPHLHVVEKDTKIDEELFLFGDVTGRRFFPFGNKRILKEVDGCRVEDTFEHEQNLVITENGKRVLISGCAHCGIVNILDRFHQIFDADPDYVITGFHLMKKTAYTEEELQLIRDTAEALLKTKTVFYSGHCTGDAAAVLKEIMQDRLILMHTGMEFEL